MKALTFVQELHRHAATCEGTVSLPSWSGRGHQVSLLQSNCDMCRTCPLPKCLLICLSCTACTISRSAYLILVFVSTQTGWLKFWMLCSCLAGVNGLNSGPWVLVEDLSSVYNDVEVERGAVKHAHKKRKLADGREKTMVSPDYMLFNPEGSDEEPLFIHIYIPLLNSGLELRWWRRLGKRSRSTHFSEQDRDADLVRDSWRLPHSKGKLGLASLPRWSRNW